MTIQEEIRRQQEEHAVGARITPEGIAAMRARIGVEIPVLQPWNEYATQDAIKHFSWGIGDDNPLYTSPEHGARTRWRGQIAFPTFISTMGMSEVKDIPEEVAEKGRGALAGIHQFYSGDEWVWYRPVHEGDRLTVRVAVVDVQEKHSQFGGVSVITRRRGLFYNQRGELVASWTILIVHAERRTAAQRGKYSEITRTQYTPEMIKQIEDDYDREEVRGANARYWEDVNVGDQLTPIVKGPMLVTDIIAFCMGWASPFVKAHKMRLAYQRKHPKALMVNEFGVPDVVERVHWDDAWARQIGNPYAYDYGWQRNAWLTQIVTNWMGDEAWLWKVDDQFRQFNYVGDTTWVKGKVTNKLVKDGDHLVDVEMWCDDQRERTTASGHALVMLPSRVHGPVLLPKPPRHLDGLKFGEPLPLEVWSATLKL